MPRFAANVQMKKGHTIENERESIEVFNYSQVNTQKA